MQREHSDVSDSLRVMSPPAGLAWRRLTLADLDAIYALHCTSIAGMEVKSVKLETRSFFVSMIGDRGQVIGLFNGADLVAYGVLQHDLKLGDNPLPALGLPAQTPICKLAGAAVAQDWRHQGLQRLLIRARLQLAGDLGVVFSTAAPSNPASWSNLLACGLAVHAIRYMYGDHPRYLMVRMPPELDNLILDAAHVGEYLDCSDLERQKLRLAQGWRGIGLAEARNAVHYQPTLPRKHG